MKVHMKLKSNLCSCKVCWIHVHCVCERWKRCVDQPVSSFQVDWGQMTESVVQHIFLAAILLQCIADEHSLILRDLLHGYAPDGGVFLLDTESCQLEARHLAF